MKLGRIGKKSVSAAVGALLSLGVAGQASADVYGLSYVDIDNLQVVIGGTGSATFFNFQTDSNAALNGVADGSDGSAQCGGEFLVFNNCNAGFPRLSGQVQNAPGGAPVRTNNDYTAYGQGTEYSSAESAIITAALLLDGATSTESISESNLVTGSQAFANTTVQSSTSIAMDFVIGDEGAFSISFRANIDVQAEVNGGDAGLAQANSTVTVQLTDALGNTVASWTPKGTSGALAECGAGLTCTSIESALDLNNANSSGGAVNATTGTGRYQLDVTGLASGNYTLALVSNTSTQLIRSPTQMPVPGTLLLLGSGLLLGARATRRKA